MEQVDILYRNSSVLDLSQLSKLVKLTQSQTSHRSVRKSNEFRKKILADNMHHEDKEAYQNAKANGRTEHVEKPETQENRFSNDNDSANAV